MESNVFFCIKRRRNWNDDKDNVKGFYKEELNIKEIMEGL